MEFDVELVPTPQRPATPLIAPKPIVTGKHKGLFIGLGVAVLMLFCGCAGVAGWMIKSMLP